MNIKSFLLKKKRVIISCVACFLIGGGLALTSNVSDQEINVIQSKNSDITCQIAKKDEVLKADKIVLETSKKDLSEYENKKEAIDKAKDDKLQKEQEAKEKAENEAKAQAEKEAKEKARQESYSNSNSSNSKSADNTSNSDNKPIGTMVWRTRTGKKYHSTNHCGRTNSANATEITLKEAEAEGLTPCSKCY
ncbi:cell envelope integrity protein TolA [Clostridium baratii]|uniref:cell envelope integrity protein TolA n=1 Tax=Clostridium baratii TaxID=1561 RepID=UPI0030CE35EB